MNPLEIYDYLTLARRRIFDWTRPLTPQQYAAHFPTTGRNLAQILTHIMISEWYYVQRMLRNDVPPDDEWPIRDEDPPPFPTLEAAWAKQAADTRAALHGVRDWAAAIQYRVTRDDGSPVLVTTSAGGLVTQLALHEVHHRAQAMSILRQLGVTLEDLDYNTLTFRREIVARE